MGRLTLVTGGAASGKSRYVLKQAALLGSRILFVATCRPGDDEMRAKVARHRAERPPEWKTVEADRDVASALAPGYDAAIVDCLTLLVSQMLVDGSAETDILAEATRLAEGASYPLFVVTNEVSWGVVPDNALARRFREIAGRANRILAERADEVILMVMGLPVRIKP